MHPEAVLLVDDGERQIAEHDVLLEHRVGADEDMNVSERQPLENVAALRPAFPAGENGDIDAGGRRQRRHGVEMLACQQFGRRHQGGLPAGFDHGRRRQKRHHRLAGADIALQQP